MTLEGRSSFCPDFVVLRSRIKVGQHRSRLLRDHGCFVVVAGKGAHGIQRVKQHDGDEFDFVAGLAAQ
jgi:hypothetical protein